MSVLVYSESENGKLKKSSFETASYGHMGRKNRIVQKTFNQPSGEKIVLDVELFTWEKLDLVEQIKAEFNL